jgi:hypothetical protein
LLKNCFFRTVNGETESVNNLEVIALNAKNELNASNVIPEKPLIPGVEEVKEKELECESEDHLLINIERYSMFDRLSKQSEDELKVYMLVSIYFTLLSIIYFFAPSLIILSKVI